MFTDCRLATAVLAGLLLVAPDLSAAPGYGDPLTVTTGTVHTVATEPELQAAVSAVNGAGVPATILLEDGTYTLSTLLHMMCNDTIIRSLSGNRDAVILRGPDEGSSAVRNNMIYNDGAGPSTDCGMGFEYANNVALDNNTVYVPTYWAPVEYRFSASSNLVFRNNLTDKAIQQRDGAPAAAMSNNVSALSPGWFLDVSQGDMHLKYGVTNIIDQGLSLAGFSNDIDAQGRPKLGAWDIGADEYDMETADSDGDGLPDGWEVAAGLSPTNAAGINGALGDPDNDRMLNWQEYVADTLPLTSNSSLRLLGLSPEAGGVRVRWQGGAAATQILEVCDALVNGGAWTPVFTGAPPTLSVTNVLDATGERTRFYRIRAVRP